MPRDPNRLAPPPDRRWGFGGALAAVLLTCGCATASRLPPAGVAERARAASSYSARLRVSLDSPDLRARTAVLIAFARPDALRLEVPGPAGARVVAVAREGSLTAVFPASRAVFGGEATAEGLGRLFGVALTPAEVMDLLLGVPSPRLQEYRVRWGRALPRHIEATLPDGGRIKVTVEEADADVDLPAAAFAPPPHPGYRSVAADEARGLWSGR